MFICHIVRYDIIRIDILNVRSFTNIQFIILQLIIAPLQGLISWCLHIRWASPIAVIFRTFSAQGLLVSDTISFIAYECDVGMALVAILL